MSCDVDARQRRLGRFVAIGMAAVHGRRKGARRPGWPGLVLASRIDAAMRWRSRCQTSSGKAGSPICARRQAHGLGRAGRDRSASAGRSSCGPSPRSHRSRRPGRPRLRRAGSRPARARRRGRRMPLAIMPAVTLARPALSAGSRRPPASKSICTSTMGMRGASDQVDLGATGLRPVLDRDGGQRGRAAQQQAAGRSARQDSGCHHGMQSFHGAGPAGGVRGLRFGSSGRGRRTPTVSWSSPKYLAATACTCSAVTPRRRCDQPLAGIQRQALDPVAAEFARLVHHRVELVDLAGDPLGLHAVQFGLARRPRAPPSPPRRAARLRPARASCRRRARRRA